MMYRFLDVSFMICLYFSVLFVGVENTSELPPPRNLNFAWETPFTINLKWEKPENLAADCNVNYTIDVTSPDCSKNGANYVTSKKVLHNKVKLDVPNENGLCISVITNPNNCTNMNKSQPKTIVIPAPPVKLVTNRSCNYSNNMIKCTWRPTVDVKVLNVYYWFSNNNNEELMKHCIPDKKQVNVCFIHDIHILNHTDHVFYLFRGIYRGSHVNNTFKEEIPNVLVNKPTLTIQRHGPVLRFQANASDSDGFHHCYTYKFLYRHCNQHNEKTLERNYFDLDYDPSCKYTARVQIFLSGSCIKGSSDLSDEVEYGKDKDLQSSALLAIILIPLIVSCFLIASLVLLRRNREIIFPNIPDPSLLFKDMLNNNIRMTDGLRTNSINRLYVPIEEIVESRISLEPDAPTD